MTNSRFCATLLASALVLSACGSRPSGLPLLPISAADATLAAPDMGSDTGEPTALPTRENFKPGQLVDYIAQTGDNLPGLAARFNTTTAEIMAANPIIPTDATTMPPGLPMKIPVYFRALWGTPFQILPDSAFVNGPSQIGFNTSAYVASHTGWLTRFSAYAHGRDRTGAEIVDFVAANWSISPRLLLAILEYKAGALTQPKAPARKYLLDYEQRIYASAGAPLLTYLQIVWAANTLNNGYYGWRSGKLTEFYAPDGTIIRPDPWQNAATVAVEYFFSRTESGQAYDISVGQSGLYSTYEQLFGAPFADESVLIPGSLRQPTLSLPYRWQQVWTYTGGPHTAWGEGEPLAAIDFAPPCDHPGCASLNPLTQVIAMADGLVVRSGPDGVVLDLDGDGDERTGWNVYYLHIAATDRVDLGVRLKAGDPMGYPSSEGGEATGTHIHVARKYNGEWIVADGPLAFNVGGWVVHDGRAAYLGTLTRESFTVTACTCSDLFSAVPVMPAP